MLEKKIYFVQISEERKESERLRKFKENVSMLLDGSRGRLFFFSLRFFRHGRRRRHYQHQRI